MRILLAAVAVMTAIAGCASSPQLAVDASPVRPKLVVLLVADGMPQRQVVDYREQLSADGFRRFLDRGAWFANAHYGHSHTATGPGHAVMLTGAYPHRTGIVGNEWLDPESGEPVYCAGDRDHSYIGHATGKLDGTSPRNLKVESLGDVLRRVNASSKVIAISGKDRGAILPAGRDGIAYMYQSATGQFASTTYYMKAHPPWVDEFHRGKPADRYFLAEWKPLLAENAYGPSLADGQPWYAKGGELPKKVGEGLDKPGTAFYGALLASPFSDQLTLDFARAAMAGERLGADDAPDILVVSLSGHDYVNHSWSAESRLSHDNVLHLDRALESFFRHLDATLGKHSYVAALTSDHGFTPAPEHGRALGRDAARFAPRPAVAKMQGVLTQRFGAGTWILGMSGDTFLLNRKLARERKVALDEVAEVLRDALLAETGVFAAYTRKELESGSRAGAPLFEQMRRSWSRELSGDVQVALKPHWIFSSGSGSATTHGSPHPDDTHVPLLLYGPRWIAPGRIDARVEVADIAPTLAGILAIPVPSSSEGKPLPLGVARF